MDNLAFTLEDGLLMIEALEALKDFKPADVIVAKINTLQQRIENGFSSYTLGEIKNICLGLELLLAYDPMDFKVNVLLQRLKSRFDIPSQL